MKIFFLTSLLLPFIFYQARAQKADSLRQKIERIVSTKNADIGVSISGIEDHDTLSVNSNRHFPLQSVFKFHIALAVLNEVDRDKLFLDKEIPVTKTDLLPDTWSPLREKYPNGDINISLAEILKYTVSQSDNNGCDILLRLIGGPKIVNDYIHKLGIKEVAIAASEEEMRKAWNVQFSNWTTPAAATELLKLFYEGKILSEKSHEYLWKLMAETSTGKERIKGWLPTGTLVAHKTGTSDTNEQGITAAVNDIGIVTLPSGKHFAISVFVSNSKENDETNEKIIADISKLTWDYFAGRAE